MPWDSIGKTPSLPPFVGLRSRWYMEVFFVMVLGIPETQKVLYLLPIMLYHSFQLFYVSWLANRIGQQVKN